MEKGKKDLSIEEYGELYKKLLEKKMLEKIGFNWFWFIFVVFITFLAIIYPIITGLLFGATQGFRSFGTVLGLIIIFVIYKIWKSKQQH